MLSLRNYGKVDGWRVVGDNRRCMLLLTTARAPGDSRAIHLHNSDSRALVSTSLGL